MNRSDLTSALAHRLSHVLAANVEATVKLLLQHMSGALASGERIELRGFGSFSLKQHPARIGRNPMTGEAVAIPEKHTVRFKPGKELRERVNSGARPAD